MKFFSKETCQKLLEIGCDNLYLFYWSQDDGNWYHWKESRLRRSDDVPAFSIADFLSDEPYATENCKKIVGRMHKSKIKVKAYKYPRFNIFKEQDYIGELEILLRQEFINPEEWFRQALLDAEDQEKFILEAVNGK